jgi:putative nucleotidyltransferase with HDIG domain
MSFDRVDTILFDWGDTVMRDDPWARGPMGTWPVVESVPGIESALAALQGRCRLVLATNANDSDAGQVRAALRRVDLDRYFSDVFTARELRVSKPDPAFFQAILERVGCLPERALFVGDSYATDIVGAGRSGLYTAWFNPKLKPCPEIHPVYSVEIREMQSLATIFDRPQLPELQECYHWLAEQGAPERLVGHCQAVAAVAFHLAEQLRIQGAPVDPLLAHRGGLLHDLDKLSSRQVGMAHGEYSAQLLLERAQPDLAEIARRHLISRLADADLQPQTWEQKLVFYADKVVEGDRFVGFSRRLEALSGRYPQYLPDFIQARPLVLRLESDLCQQLGCSLEDLYRDLADVF